MKIVIIGGGIGGLATAAGLQRLGIKADIFEQAKTFKPLGAGIGIGSNAMLALQKLGVKSDQLNGMPLHEQRFLNENLQVMNTIDFSLLKKRFGEETIAIQRTDLHEALLQTIDPSDIHFNKKLTSFKQFDNKVELTFNNGEIIYADYVIAADGIHSQMRQELVPGSLPQYAGYTCWRGITANNGRVKAHTSSEAWAAFGRFGFAPLQNNLIYWFACINEKANDEYFQSFSKYELANYFSRYDDNIKNIIAETKDDYFLHHDIYDIKPLAKYIYRRIALLGDAAHATTPNMGQGAGQAIEDAYTLMEAIQETDSIEEAFTLYEKRRWKKTKKVMKLSRQIGAAAQWEHPALIWMRNTAFPFVPKSLLFKRLTFLFKDI